MRILSLPLPLWSAADAEAAICSTEASTLAPATRIREPGPLNLARPWKFPAGHADSIRCRRHSRASVELPVQFSLHRQDGSSYDQGSGVIQDLSYSGLRLGDVFLPRGRLLATSFVVHLRHAFESPVSATIAGRILRGSTSGVPDFGIEFLFPDSGAEARLRERR